MSLVSKVQGKQTILLSLYPSKVQCVDSLIIVHGCEALFKSHNIAIAIFLTRAMVIIHKRNNTGPMKRK